MERPSKLKIKILKFLSQAAAPAVTYKSPPASPRNPIVSIIPKEARRKPRNGSSSFATKEPTSPKVSCMGQVKGKKKKKKSKSKPKQVGPPPPPPQESTSLALSVPKEKTFKVSNVIPKVLINNKGKTKDDGSVATSSLSRTSRVPERVPSLGQMKRFESGRGVLSDFDLIKVDDDDDNMKIGVGGDEEYDDEDEKKEVIILWKRRSMSPPMPLQL
ncbi:uncharacterized protein At1g76070-like [Rosa rugosa]|uniref:uncharacterized protein At1g76070-like n=1 Tax=Rosa rugosa TaxID=74645 RepID=UPI002B405068|nr:uncharacterized protein At1g76070-like [Rosa rugosa]